MPIHPCLRVAAGLGALLLVASATAAAIDTIAFGSCIRQGKPQPVWEAVNALEPDVFLLLGDNVYADTTDMDAMRATYGMLAAEPGFVRLRSRCPIHATWDDHDYGANDAGAEYPMRAESEQIFLDFFEVPPNAPERGRPGVYSHQVYGPPGQRVQIILLDTRYFRSPLVRAPATPECPRVNHAPNRDPGATVLGAEQWRWLGERLREPADLRILASSIQVIPEEHCYEKWANFPLERERLLRLVRETDARGLILLSGDRHLAEISRLPAAAVGYPLYELTSSGMNAGGAGEGETNRYRVGPDNVRADNFGVVRVDWSKAPAELALEIHTADGRVAQRVEFPLAALAPEPQASPGNRPPAY